jgi:hypothetical protein
MPITSDELTQRLKERLPLMRSLRKTAIELENVKKQIIEKRKKNNDPDVTK